MSEKKAGRIIVVNKKKEVLLGRRTSQADFGKLSVPGGKPNDGESIKEAAVREVEEETGLQLNNPIFFTESDFKGWLTSFYFAVVEDILIPPSNEEHSEFLLISLKEIDALENQIGFNHFIILKQFFKEKGDSLGQ